VFVGAGAASAVEVLPGGLKRGSGLSEALGCVERGDLLGVECRRWSR
jgi:hypothetical protein